MSLPPYPKYKDSRVEWLADVPEPWRISRVKHNTYLKGRVGWKGLTSDEYLEHGHAYLITGTDFCQRYIRWSDCHWVDRVRYEDDPFIQLKNGDLLITKDGTIGKLALVAELDKPACLNSGIFLVRPIKDYTADFMFWVLSSESFRVFCDLSSMGSTIQHLYQNVFENFSFPVPARDEQNAIIKFLDRETSKIDALVEEQQRLIELLKEKRQAVISHAVTRGLSPNAPMKESGIEWLGEVPEHWQVLQLGKVCSKVADGPHFSPDYFDEGIPFLSARNVRVDSWALDDVKYISIEDCEVFDRRVIPRPGDVLYTKGGTTGVARAVDLDFRFQVWVHVAVLRLKPEVVVPEFLAFALNSIGCYEQSQLLTRGATNNDLGLTRMIKIWIVLPPIDEQIAILNELNPAFVALNDLIQEATRAIDLLQERRTALISAAITGKIDVRGLAAEDAA